MVGPRVLLAHHDVLIRDVVRTACERRGVELVAEAGEAPTLRRLVATGLGDVVVVADRLDGCPAERLVPELVDADTKVVVLSADPSPNRLTALLSAGASGYFLHDADPDEIATAVQAVGRGAAALHPTAAATVLAQWRRLRAGASNGTRGGVSSLTPRESEVLAAMAAGLATKAIAARLSLAVKTVENHKIRIFDKLGVRSQAQAVAVALAHGVAVPAPGGDEPG
jgi:DNA-binding NarL/FixJ family response regulator